MRRSFISIFIIIFSGFFCVVQAKGKPPISVEAFITSIEQEVTGPQPFFRFAKVIDPFGAHLKGAESIQTYLRKAFRGKDAQFDVLYRNRDSEKAETIIGAIWSGEDYAFLAFVLHKRPDGWLPISYSLQSSYENILKYK